MNKALQFRPNVPKRLLTRHAPGTTSHPMEICFHRKNTHAIASGHDDWVALGTYQQIDHSSGHCLAKIGRDIAMILGPQFGPERLQLR